jgi:hypothetical protein
MESRMVGFTRIAASTPALGPADLATFTRLVHAHGPLAATEIHLDRHSFGLEGLVELLPLFASVATHVPNLVKLDLSYNALGDAGVARLCEALVGGGGGGGGGAASAPVQLQHLNLTYNGVGDAGFGALQRAIQSGALQVSEDLAVVDGNKASSEAGEQLVHAWKLVQKTKAAAAAAKAAAAKGVTPGGSDPGGDPGGARGSGAASAKKKAAAAAAVADDGSSDDSFSDDEGGDGSVGGRVARAAVDLSDPFARLMNPMAHLR